MADQYRIAGAASSSRAPVSTRCRHVRVDLRLAHGERRPPQRGDWVITGSHGDVEARPRDVAGSPIAVVVDVDADWASSTMPIRAPSRGSRRPSTRALHRRPRGLAAVAPASVPARKGSTVSRRSVGSSTSPSDTRTTACPRSVEHRRRGRRRSAPRGPSVAPSTATSRRPAHELCRNSSAIHSSSTCRSVTSFLPSTFMRSRLRPCGRPGAVANGGRRGRDLRVGDDRPPGRGMREHLGLDAPDLADELRA